MIIRKKLVIIKIRLGASASKVKMISTFRLVTSWDGVSGALRLRFIVGTVGAAKERANSEIISKKAFKSFFQKLHLKAKILAKVT